MLYVGLRIFFRILFRTLFRLQVIGKENIPEQGAVILCSNHISLWDPPVVGTPLSRRVNFMAKEELFRIPVFNWVIKQLGAFPVKRGGVSKQSIRHATELLRNGNVLCIFPEGSRQSGGMGKKGAASLAFKTEVTVIPVAIIGNYKLFRKMKILYGPPVDLSEFKEEHTSQNLELATEKIMQSIRELIKNEK